MIEKNNFNEIEGKEILNKLFNKELNSKKNILEAIEIIRPLAKEELKGEKLQEIYNIIYNSIEDMNTIVKANTIMYLKNQLKSALGKYVENKDPKEMNCFLEFFKEAYPTNNRRIGYTRVINDFNKITNEQIWETLTYVNRIVIKTKRKLGEDEIEDIIKNHTGSGSPASPHNGAPPSARRAPHHTLLIRRSTGWNKSFGGG